MDPWSTPKCGVPYEMDDTSPKSRSLLHVISVAPPLWVPILFACGAMKGYHAGRRYHQQLHGSHGSVAPVHQPRWCGR